MKLRKFWACPEWFINEDVHKEPNNIYMMFWHQPPTASHNKPVYVLTEEELKEVYESGGTVHRDTFEDWQSRGAK